MESLSTTFTLGIDDAQRETQVKLINLCFTRNSTMWSLINVSSNLHTTGVKLTGL